MDDRRFDSLVKAWAQNTSRRSVLKGMLGLGGGVFAGGLLRSGDAGAARRSTPTPTANKCPGLQSWNGSQCACPPTAPNICGPACCTGQPGDSHTPTYTECCDGACCAGTCFGEEQCCPTNPGPGEQPPTHQVCETLDGTLCCPYGGDCCSIDGCCGTVCVGGPDGRSYCCAESDVCAGGPASSGLCCTGSTPLGCQCGTDANACIGDSLDDCCSDEDCSADGPFDCRSVACDPETHTCVRTPNDAACGPCGICDAAGQCSAGTCGGICSTCAQNPQTGAFECKSLCGASAPQCCSYGGREFCIPIGKSCCYDPQDYCSVECEVCDPEVGYCVPTTDC